MYSREKNAEESLIYLDDLLCTLHQNIWVRKKVALELSKHNFSYKTRKKRRKLNREYTETYVELYAELFNPSQAAEEENLEVAAIEKPRPVQLTTYTWEPELKPEATSTEPKENLPELEQFLDDQSLHSLKLNTPKSKIKLVREVLQFVSRHRNQCRNSLGLVLYHMKYKHTLPVFAGQVTKMRFGKEPMRDNCLKLNVGQGRLVMFFEETQLHVRYYTNQEYHTIRTF